nr:MAG TPA: hypothetical protein [Caudoviricetes sp.]
MCKVKSNAGFYHVPAPPWFVRIGRFFLTESSFLNKI